MSSPVSCDACKKTGRRRMGHIAPEDWLFGEATVQEDGEPPETIFVYACSATCAASFWTQGPGKLDLTEPAT